MTKGKAVSTSLQGKKPVNTAKRRKAQTRNPGRIKNKLKRSEMYGAYLTQKRAAQREARLRREKEGEELGEELTQKTKTLDNTREVEATMVLPDDEEVALDEADDEFAPYFSGEKPKVLVTTRPRPSHHLFHFIADLQKLIPELHYYPRKTFSLETICQSAVKRDFTHVMILTETSKVCDGLTISHVRKHGDTLQAGPTAYFKVSQVVTSQDIPHHGASTAHIPELNVNGFGTRLGRRVGRLLASLFPQNAQLQGRQVVSFHNQRDYIFVRQHRYMFRDRQGTEKSKAAYQDTAMPHVQAKLQELGPRFTLKLRWLQEGTFEDGKSAEYEWLHKRKEMDTTRRKFHI